MGDSTSGWKLLAYIYHFISLAGTEGENSKCYEQNYVPLPPIYVLKT